MDEPGAIWVPTTQHFPDRAGHSPRWVIVHGTAGFTNAHDVAVYFQHAEASTHYIIGQDGTIYQCVAEAQAAWGNGGVTTGHAPWWSPNLNPNYVSISIEHHKPHRDNSDHLTAAQKAASFRLIAHICERHAIPKRLANAQGGITGHFSMDPVNRSYCPGPYPWDELFSFLLHGDSSMLELSTPQVATFFEDAGGGSWRCHQTSMLLHGAILAFYRSFNGNTGNACFNGLTHLGLPLSNELYPQPGIAIQHFERGVLAYDPHQQLDQPPGAGSVYLMHIDRGPGADPRLTLASTQLTALNQQQRDLQSQISELQAVNADFHRQVVNLRLQLEAAQRPTPPPTAPPPQT